jgi:hypothetical protein
MQIHIRDSRASTGARARITDIDPSAVRGPAEIDFSDGSVATGQFQRQGDNVMQLWVHAYVTAQGNSVSAHEWRMELTSAKGVWKLGRRDDPAEAVIKPR